MGEFIKVIPSEGQKVLHPDFPHVAIPNEGMQVRKGTYWNRLLKQGAVRFEEIEEADSSSKQVEKKSPPKKGLNDAV